MFLQNKPAGNDHGFKTFEVFTFKNCVYFIKQFTLSKDFLFKMIGKIVFNRFGKSYWLLSSIRFIYSTFIAKQNFKCLRNGP